jgi:putative transposase
MKYEFIKAHEQEFAVGRMCGVLGVGRSGYYDWRARPQSQRAKANEDLLKSITTAFENSRKTYGSPRIHAYLCKKGTSCGRNRVARLMQKRNLVAKKGQKRRPQTTKQRSEAKIAHNLLNREFTATQPNKKWVSDFTYIGTAEGWLYLAAILDLYSRRVVGWAMSDSMDVKFVEAAWKMAILHRQPTGDLLHHSDRGSQYTSETYLDRLTKQSCQISMSRTGNCYDNAPIESFFSTLKAECADRQFVSRAAARTAIFEFIEVWYNRQRLHSTLGYLSPVDFECAS